MKIINRCIKKKKKKGGQKQVNNVELYPEFVT